MQPIATDVSVVGRSVCDVTLRYAAKTADVEMLFGMWSGVGDSHHVLDGGADSSTGRGNFGVGKGPSHSKVGIMEREP